MGGAEDRRLLSLAVPWALIALVSIGAAVFYGAGAKPSDNILQGSLERLLQGTQQHHKQVYEEMHAPLFPLTDSDRIGFLCAIIGLMIAAGGGIGGGGILVPIYILVMGFSPKHAIPLSNITVFGGALANMVLNTQKRHPLADRPLVDWDLILVMEPLTIAGALIGAFMNKVLPETLLVVMLVVLLSFTAYNTLKKAIKMYKLETIKLREQGLKPDGTKESELTHIDSKDRADGQIEAGDELLKNMDLQEGESPGVGDMESPVIDQRALQELNQILDEERVAQKTNITILVCMFVVVLAINLLKGGGAFPSPVGIKCGSTAFWLANGIMLGWIVMISLYVRSYLVQRYETKKRVGYEYVEGDIKWDGRATIVYPVVCCLAGFFAGMFGVGKFSLFTLISRFGTLIELTSLHSIQFIGGGIVKGPLMLAMGVHPAVASASSACMILFTSFTATTSFFVFGLLDPEYAPVCFCVGFIATYFGQIGLSILMRRAQRNSYIAFSIGGVVLLSSLLMTIQSLLSMAEGEHHSSGGICGKDS